MDSSPKRPAWGATPWTIAFRPASSQLPAETDFAVIGGGFTGLAAAAWLRHLAPEKTVVLLESCTIGAGASGRTGGMALAETAAGDMPGLGDVLSGFSDTLRDLGVDCDLRLPGVWELARRNPLPHSPIAWADSGNLCAVAEVPGGTIDPGKMLSGLARSAERGGALIVEGAPVRNVAFDHPIRLQLPGRELRALSVLFACNAQSLEISSLSGVTEPKFTLATATAPLTTAQLAELGLSSGKPFYTVELPYLWGRLLSGSGIVLGAGLLHLRNWRDLDSIDVASGEPLAMFERFERRVRNFHPRLSDVRFTHRWGGPILAGAGWDMRPVFRRHPASPRAIVLGAYSGHGVALSVYLGRWAAEALLGRKELPEWNTAGTRTA